jgi:putative ribosome biogenesis GTPase RsgA
VNPRGLSVDVLNDDTGDLLRSRAGWNTYSVRLTHDAEANNNPRTEAHKGSLFFGLSGVGKSY